MQSVSPNSNQAPSLYKSESNLLEIIASVRNTTVISSLRNLISFQDPGWYDFSLRVGIKSETTVPKVETKLLYA